MTVKTSEVVRSLLAAVDDEKAVGSDNISLRLLGQCAAELAYSLTTLCNNCLSSSHWFSAWKESRTVPVHKKNSKTKIKNYRPVLLLPVLSKVLETMMTR